MLAVITLGIDQLSINQSTNGNYALEWGPRNGSYDWTNTAPTRVLRYFTCRRFPEPSLLGWLVNNEEIEKAWLVNNEEIEKTKFSCDIY